MQNKQTMSHFVNDKYQLNMKFYTILFVWFRFRFRCALPSVTLDAWYGALITYAYGVWWSVWSVWSGSDSNSAKMNVSLTYFYVYLFFLCTVTFILNARRSRVLTNVHSFFFILSHEHPPYDSSLHCNNIIYTYSILYVWCWLIV